MCLLNAIITLVGCFALVTGDFQSTNSVTNDSINETENVGLESEIKTEVHESENSSLNFQPQIEEKTHVGPFQMPNQIAEKSETGAKTAVEESKLGVIFDIIITEATKPPETVKAVVKPDISSNEAKTEAVESFDISSWTPKSPRDSANTTQTEDPQVHQQADNLFRSTKAPQSPDVRITGVQDLQSSKSPVSIEGPEDMTHSCHSVHHPNLSLNCAYWLFNNYHQVRGGWKPCSSYAPAGDSRCGLWWAKCKQSQKNKHCCRSVRCHLKHVYGVTVG